MTLNYHLAARLCECVTEKITAIFYTPEQREEHRRRGALVADSNWDRKSSFPQDITPGNRYVYTRMKNKLGRPRELSPLIFQKPT